MPLHWNCLSFWSTVRFSFSSPCYGIDFCTAGASGKGGNAYSAGYIHHLRDISDEVYSLDPTTQTIYSAFLVSAVLLKSPNKPPIH